MQEGVIMLDPYITWEQLMQIIRPERNNPDKMIKTLERQIEIRDTQKS